MSRTVREVIDLALDDAILSNVVTSEERAQALAFLDMRDDKQPVAEPVVWLVERTEVAADHNPAVSWLKGFSPCMAPEWTDDANDAIRFVRMTDAAMIAMKCIRPVHGVAISCTDHVFTEKSLEQVAGELGLFPKREEPGRDA